MLRLELVMSLPEAHSVASSKAASLHVYVTADEQRPQVAIIR